MSDKTRTLTRKPTGVTNRTEGGLTDKALAENARQYITLKEEAKTIASRTKELRDRLIDLVERYGYESDKGHQFLDLPEEVGGFKRLQRQRRTSVSMDEEALIALLKKKGAYDDVVEVVTIERIDQEALARAVFEKRITEKELNALTTTKVTWALTPSKD